MAGKSVTSKRNGRKSECWRASPLSEKLSEKGKTFPGFWLFFLVNYRKLSLNNILMSLLNTCIYEKTKKWPLCLSRRRSRVRVSSSAPFSIECRMVIKPSGFLFQPAGGLTAPQTAFTFSKAVEGPLSRRPTDAGSVVWCLALYPARGGDLSESNLPCFGFFVKKPKNISA